MGFLSDARGRLRAVAIVAAAVTALVAAGEASSVAQPPRVRGVTDVGPVPGLVNLTGFECPAESDCQAVGELERGSGLAPAVAHWDGGHWTVQLLPGTRLGIPLSLSCSGPKACVTVGATGNDPAGLRLFVWRFDGSWTAEPVEDPALRLTSPSVSNSELDGVLCAAATSCVATGRFASTPASDGIQFDEISDGSSWAFRRVHTGDATIDTVLCSLRGECFDQRGSIGGVPGEFTIPAIPTRIGLSDTATGDISCVSHRWCMAVGFGPDGAAIAEVLRGRSWSRPLPLPHPSDVDALTGVQCQSTTSCIAVGSLTARTGARIALWNGVAWSYSPRHAGLTFVSCPSRTVCRSTD